MSGRVSLGSVIQVARPKWVEGASEVVGAASAKALRQDTWFISKAGRKVGSRERQGREVAAQSRLGLGAPGRVGAVSGLEATDIH